MTAPVVLPHFKGREYSDLASRHRRVIFGARDDYSDVGVACVVVYCLSSGVLCHFSPP